MPPRSITPPNIQEPHPSDPHPISIKPTEKESRKKKFIPWEPFKAAPSSDRKGTQPKNLPEKLIPYSVNVEEGENRVEDSSNGRSQLIDTRRLMKLRAEGIEESEVITHLEEQLNAAQSQILMERDLNSELKRLLVATVDEDFECHVNALSQDKVTLARRLDQYAHRLQNEDEQMETLSIERDVWKCKFLAMSIRADELKSRNEELIKMIRCIQHTLSESGDLMKWEEVGEDLKERIKSLTRLDLRLLFERSPTEEKLIRPPVNYHNLTIGCCKNCSGREIQLL